MVRYVLRCSEQHKFEAWLRSESDFERTFASGKTGCPICEIAAIERPDAVSMLPKLTGSTSRPVLQ